MSLHQEGLYMYLAHFSLTILCFYRVRARVSNYVSCGLMPSFQEKQNHIMHRQLAPWDQTLNPSLSTLHKRTCGFRVHNQPTKLPLEAIIPGHKPRQLRRRTLRGPPPGTTLLIYHRDAVGDQNKSHPRPQLYDLAWSLSPFTLCCFPILKRIKSYKMYVIQVIDFFKRH